ncbi:Sodium/calcium exchanger protein-domain-containing protein [Chytriomyces cf. hyalinus JEL632]|nr:Sodium/calcium exchanger protein-domain-containing protein [Chytriomyces cf. hyalinus JEL632]
MASERTALLPRQTQGHTHSDVPEVTVLSSLAALWQSNKLFNIAALIFVPLGTASARLGWADTWIFALNFCAIIPLAKMLDFSTDQLAMRTGPTIGGLLNATFGNAVELILSVFALREGLLDVVKASIIGSILSNLLLVLGFCFLFGGLIPFVKNKFQKFDVDKANVSTGLLVLTFLGFLVPAVVRVTLEDQTSDPADSVSRVLAISRGIAFVLLLSYIALLVFQLYTNPDGLLVTPRRPHPANPRLAHSGTHEEGGEEEDEEEEPITLAWIALLSLALTTVVIAFSAEMLVGSVEGLSKEAHISEVFIGIIILPIVGNAAEHVTAISSAMRDKMDLSLQVAVGSALQIALLVAPAIVLSGWAMDKNMDLDFGLFSTAILFVTVLVVNSLIQDGRTHWLEGWMLLAAYFIIAIGFYYIPEKTEIVNVVMSVLASRS